MVSHSAQAGHCQEMHMWYANASRRTGEQRKFNGSVRRCSRWSCTQPWVHRFCCAL